MGFPEVKGRVEAELVLRADLDLAVLVSGWSARTRQRLLDNEDSAQERLHEQIGDRLRDRAEFAELSVRHLPDKPERAPEPPQFTVAEAQALADSFMGGSPDPDALNSVAPKLEAILGKELG